MRELFTDEQVDGLRAQAVKEWGMSEDAAAAAYPYNELKGIPASAYGPQQRQGKFYPPGDPKDYQKHG